MAGDTVTSKVLFAGKKLYVIKITNISDGTGESGVVKVDKSTLTGLTGVEPAKIAVEQIKGIVDGMTVTLSFDRTSAITIAILGGLGTCNVDLDWRDVGGILDTGSGNTGDIKLTTTAHSSGDSYDLTLYCRLVN